MVDVSIDFDVFLTVAVGRGGGRASYLHEKVEGVEKKKRCSSLPIATLFTTRQR